MTTRTRRLAWGTLVTTLFGMGLLVVGPVGHSTASAASPDLTFCPQAAEYSRSVTVPPSGAFSLTIPIPPFGAVSAPTLDISGPVGTYPAGTVATACSVIVAPTASYLGVKILIFFGYQITLPSSDATFRTSHETSFVLSSPLLTPQCYLLYLGMSTPWSNISEYAGGLSFDDTSDGSFNVLASEPPVTPPPAGESSPGESWTRSIPTPTAAFRNIGQDGVDLAIAGGGALLITFPAQLFNLTLDENYEEVTGWWRRRLKWLGQRWPKHPRHDHEPGAPPATEPAVTAPSPASQAEGSVDAVSSLNAVTVVILIGAVLGTLLNASTGFNVASFDRYAATVGGLILGLAVSWAAVAAYGRAHQWPTIGVRARPFGLVIALACVLVSRLIDFQPGYLYGVVCALAIPVKLNPREESHVAVLASAAALAVGVLAWCAWIPVHHADQTGGGLGWTLADNLLAVVFVAAFVGTVINLIPVRLLPGSAVYRWSRVAWAAAFTLALFVVVAAIARSPVSPGAHHSPIIVTAALFAVFLGGSIWFREHYVRRWRRAHGAPLHGLADHVRALVAKRDDVIVGAVVIESEEP